MKKVTTGKLFLSNLFFATQFIWATCEIQVQILNQAGNIVSEVSAGVPFQLHIVAKGDCDVSEIEFSPDFNICKMSALGTIKSVSNLNRVINHAITHRYLMRIDQVGHYQLGPIKLKHLNNIVGSTHVAINVRHQVAPKANANNLSVELKISKQKVYVGEKFEARVRFYCNDLSIINNVALNFPADFKDQFECQVIHAPVSGSPNGQKNSYLEWNLVLSAKKSGDLLLPAIGVIFEKKQQVRQFLIFQNQVQEEIFSNAARLQVCDLPPIDPQSKFAQISSKSDNLPIGTFTGFSAKIDHTALKDGQAARLVLTLTGDGNWEQINIPLTNVPKNLQSYAGVVTQSEHEKDFEYVLQGVQTGICKLPAQHFAYFDPLAAEYKILTTSPIELNVLSVPVLVHQNLTNHHSNVDVVKNLPIRPIMETWSAQEQAKYYLPLWWFVVLILSPLLILIMKTIYDYYNQRSQKGLIFFKNQVAVFEKNKQISLLYSLFTQILTQKFHLSPAQINARSIDEFLRGYEVSAEVRQSFCLFYDDLAALAFANDGKYLDLSIFHKAQDWLIFLEGLVMQNAKKN